MLSALAFFALLVLAGCDISEIIIAPSLGVIEVTIQTEGLSQAPDSFNVFLNGSRSGAVGPNGLYRMTALPSGTYQVGLQEEPDVCRFSENPRKVTLQRSGTSFVTFLVICK